MYDRPLNKMCKIENLLIDFLIKHHDEKWFLDVLANAYV